MQYTPDWFFAQKLRELDPTLRVKWDSERERFRILRLVDDLNFTSRGFIHVMYVEFEDGSYKPLDERTLIILKQTAIDRVGMSYYRDAERRERAREYEEMETLQQDTEDIIKQDILPAAKKMANDLATINIPKADVAEAMFSPYTEAQLEGEPLL